MNTIIVNYKAIQTASKIESECRRLLQAPVAIDRLGGTTQTH